MPETYKQSFKQSLQKNTELSIYNCGLQSCESGHTWGPGIRDHYLIHLVVSGKGKYTANGQEFHLHAGDVFLAKPNQLITYSADTKSPWEYYWVGFNGTYANKLVGALPFNEHSPVHCCKEFAEVKQALLNIFLARGTNKAGEVAMVGHLYLFISQLIKEAAASQASSATSGAQYVVNAVKYIQFNYSHDISVDDISKATGVSRSHLYRVFMQNIGQSPIDYLIAYRINEACTLLKSSEYSIAEIAVSVGFFDQFYFSRVFKKIKGVPPSKFVAASEK